MGAPEDVVVTGVALTTPLGATLADVWAAARVGRSAFKPISLYDPEKSDVRFAGEHDAPDLKLLSDRKFGKILSRRDLTAVLAVARAYADAGIPTAGYAPDRLGIVVGASCTHLGDMTPSLVLVAKHADLDAGTFNANGFGREFMETLNPIVVLRLLMNNAVCFGSISLQLKGVNSNYMQQEVSGLRALGEGYLAIREGRADAVVCGGTAQPVEPFQIHEAKHLGLLADQRAAGFRPDAAVRPYDGAASGTMLSEATAFLVLERGAAARARGARILGTVRGFGVAADGEPDGATPATAATGLIRAFGAACHKGDVPLDAIGAVLGSGNGVPASDAREALALRACLGRRVADVPVASVKGAVGESAEAHGAVSVALALAALAEGVAPATANFTRAAPSAASLRLASAPQPLVAPVVAVTSRTRAGVSAVLLLGR